MRGRVSRTAARRRRRARLRATAEPTLRLAVKPTRRESAGSALRSVESALVAHPVHVNLPADLPLLYGDGVLLERLLANLFENAAKYTPAGTPITLTARLDGAQMVAEVSDEGPGFPPGDTELLFEKFARGNKESRTPGVGLGLAICRAIVQAHGGTISASNRTPPQHGAVLRWTLPFKQTPDVPESIEATSPPSQ